MATTPNSLITPQNVKTKTAVATAAKTDYTTATGAVRLVSQDVVPNGALIKRITAIPRATTTGNIQCQIYRSYDFGVTLSLIDVVVLPAQTISAASGITKAVFDYTSDTPLRVQAGEELWCAISVGLTQGVVFNAEAEVY